MSAEEVRPANEAVTGGVDHGTAGGEGPADAAVAAGGSPSAPATPSGGDPSKLYGEHYFQNYQGGSYDEDNPNWVVLFANIASRIATDVGPTSALDAGCAKGFLVSHMRSQGIEAFGVDISPYAIEAASATVRPHLWCGSLVDELPRDYDLITCLEVLEHLSPTDAELAIANICRHTDDILFSSTPTDYHEASHVNVRPTEWWASVFAKNGFFRDVDYDLWYIAPWAIRFRRRRDPLPTLIGSFERVLGRTLVHASTRERLILEQETELQRIHDQLTTEESRHRDQESALQTELDGVRAELTHRIEPLSERLERLTDALSYAEHHIVLLERERQGLEARLATEQARSGQATHVLAERLHTLARRALPYESRRGSYLASAVRGAMVLTGQGPGRFAAKTADKLAHSSPVRRARSHLHVRGRTTGGAPVLEPAPGAPADAGYEQWLRDEYYPWLQSHEPDARGLARLTLESQAWRDRPLVSVIMPVFNTDPRWLIESIESVRGQTYDRWELCIADDCSTDHRIGEILESKAREDPRIRVVHRAVNGGISEATNSALEVATGEYVAFLDHDDVMRPHALHRMIEYLREHPDTGLVYSDEDKLRPDETRGIPFFKPDWSPDLMFCANYLCHLTVIRKSIVDQIGPLDPALDGAQDWDFFLRAVETGCAVGHVSDILYSWRQAEGSAALSNTSKPYAYIAGQKAIELAIARRGLAARVTPGASLGWYYVHHAIVDSPRVGIIIPTRDRVDLLEACIDSVEKLSTYDNRQVLIVNNDSREPETLEYLRECGHRVLDHPGHFNYASIMNHAAREMECDHIVFLNNDTTVIARDWIEAMLEHSQRPDVGAVGCRLVYPGGVVQHEGVSLMLDYPIALDLSGYFGLSWAIREVAAVTGACLMTRRSEFCSIGGFDERYRIAYNDVDLCLRLREKGRRIIYTPLAALNHTEGSSRGSYHPVEDAYTFRDRWSATLGRDDPYVNRNIRSFSPLRLRIS